MATSSKISAVGLRDVGFALLCIVSVAAVLIGQIVSLMAFDVTGLDIYVPGPVIYSVVPAVLVTAIPAVVAVRRYARQRALVITAGVFTAAIVASVLFLINFWIIG